VPTATIITVRPRFYLPDLDASGHGVLAEDEVAHLTRVLRLGVGAEIDVFDGRGGMFHARLTAVERGSARVEVLGPAARAPEARVRVTLVMSVLKGEKMDDVVRDAVMMGVAALQPVVTAHGEVGLGALARGHRAERWQRIAVASVKQSGRAVVPLVRPPLAFEGWLREPATEPVLVLCEPSSGPAGPLHAVPSAAAVQLLVGPEGGWSGEERGAFAAAGFYAVSLGGRTLRADAAPLVALSALYEAWDAW
jgi:16S rRNA (uracil1498-N3)-methyltransferase